MLIYIHNPLKTNLKVEGTKSYIVAGLGNTDSFMSCSHGAGRKMGRGAATRNLNLQEEIDRNNVTIDFLVKKLESLFN